MKQRWFILICLLALLAVGMPVAAKSANLLKNSGFESMENLQPKLLATRCFRWADSE